MSGTQANSAGDGSGPSPDDGLLPRLRHQWNHRLDPDERGAVTAWAAFGVTFGIARAITHTLHWRNPSASGGITIAGHHVHHYNFGILGLFGVGSVAVHGPERRRRHPLTAIGYGVSTALIIDEAALLIDLENVYWAKQGRDSVDVAVGLIALGGVVVVGSSFWLAAAQELKRNRQRR